MLLISDRPQHSFSRRRWFGSTPLDRQYRRQSCLKFQSEATTELVIRLLSLLVGSLLGLLEKIFV